MKNSIMLLLFSCAFTMLYGQTPTITPQWATYLKNTYWHGIRDVVTDKDGNIICVGGTGTKKFKISKKTFSSPYAGGKSDAFIIKLNPNGDILWSALIGGKGHDRAYAVETDSAGYIYVAGRAGAGIQTTPGVLQAEFAGDNNPNPAYGQQDAFIAKISPDGGQLVWCTYIGCPGRGFIRDIDIDSKGNVWAGVSATGPGFKHITQNGVQKISTISLSAALIKLSPDGAKVVYGTYLNDGVANDEGGTTVRVDKNDNVVFLSHASAQGIPVTAGVFQPQWAGKTDFVISKFDSAGNLIFCSYLGGSSNEGVETHSLEVDSKGNPVIAAYTMSPDFPLRGSPFQASIASFGEEGDGVICKVSADGSKILASTYMGGEHHDEIEGIGIDSADNVYITGTTQSRKLNFSTKSALQDTMGGKSDAFVAMLSPGLSRVAYFTYLGGPADEKLRTCHVQGNRLICGGTFTTKAITGIKIKNTRRVKPNCGFLFTFKIESPRN